MLSLGSDNAIKIWDLKRLKAVHEIQASNSNPTSNPGNNNAVVNASPLVQPNSNAMSKVGTVLVFVFLIAEAIRRSCVHPAMNYIAGCVGRSGVRDCQHLRGDEAV